MDIEWQLKSFNQLLGIELYAILKLRAEVFVVEQNCPYQDLDGKDLKSLHILGTYNNELITYARLLPPKISYDEPSIGRVVSSPKYRKKGVGLSLMEKAIEFIYSNYGEQPIKIGAQLYLKKFYEKFGFIQIGDEYLEDNIPHIQMLKK